MRVGPFPPAGVVIFPDDSAGIVALRHSDYPTVRPERQDAMPVLPVVVRGQFRVRYSRGPSVTIGRPDRCRGVTGKYAMSVVQAPVRLARNNARLHPAGPWLPAHAGAQVGDVGVVVAAVPGVALDEAADGKHAVFRVIERAQQRRPVE